MSFVGKVALVTGGGSGIGKAVALRLGLEGARVGVLSNIASKNEQVAEEIEARGGYAMPLAADVGDADEMRSAVAGLVREWGRLDFVFANAGINGVWAPIDELSPDEWDRTLTTNLRGTYLTLHVGVPYMKQAGGGAIVITSSTNGTRVFSIAGSSAYACSKAAQVALATTQAVELARYGIRVNVICPGAIETDIGQSTVVRLAEPSTRSDTSFSTVIPLTGDQPGSADQVADLVLFLLSDAAAHITGTSIWIDGAQSLAQS